MTHAGFEGCLKDHAGICAVAYVLCDVEQDATPRRRRAPSELPASKRARGAPVRYAPPSPAAERAVREQGQKRYDARKRREALREIATWQGQRRQWRGIDAQELRFDHAPPFGVVAPAEAAAVQSDLKMLQRRCILFRPDAGKSTEVLLQARRQAILKARTNEPDSRSTGATQSWRSRPSSGLSQSSDFRTTISSFSEPGTAPRASESSSSRSRAA